MATNATDRSRTVLDLFELYYGRVYCFARRSVPADVAEDIAQDVFIRLLEHKNLENMEISVSYLLKVADNLIKRRWQRNQRFGRYQDRVRAEQGFPQPRGAEHASTILDDEGVNRALAELPARERAAVEMIVCQDMSYEQAAESLGVRVTTVNNWKYRGIQKLKNHAREDVPDRNRRHDSHHRELATPHRGHRQQESRSSAPEADHAGSLLHPAHPAFERRQRA
jgi:RNA polymerase sigma factor (sigma-70 family)